MKKSNIKQEHATHVAIAQLAFFFGFLTCLVAKGRQ